MIVSEANNENNGPTIRGEKKRPRGKCFDQGKRHFHQTSVMAVKPVVNVHQFLPPLVGACNRNEVRGRSNMSMSEVLELDGVGGGGAVSSEDPRRSYPTTEPISRRKTTS